MAGAYGVSGQGAALSVGSLGPLLCTRIRLAKTFNNADTTVTDDGWGKLCPVYRDWRIEVEMPCRSADDSKTITEAFDQDAFNANNEDVDIPEVGFFLGGHLGRYSGNAMLDGDVVVDDSAKDAVRLTFTLKGSGPLTRGS